VVRAGSQFTFGALSAEEERLLGRLSLGALRDTLSHRPGGRRHPRLRRGPAIQWRIRFHRHAERRNSGVRRQRGFPCAACQVDEDLPGLRADIPINGLAPPSVQRADPEHLDKMTLDYPDRALQYVVAGAGMASSTASILTSTVWFVLWKCGSGLQGAKILVLGAGGAPVLLFLD